MKKKISCMCMGAFVLVLIITISIAVAAISYGNSRPDLPIAIGIFGLMLTGFISLLAGCRLWDNRDGKKPSQ